MPEEGLLTDSASVSEEEPAEAPPVNEFANPDFAEDIQGEESSEGTEQPDSTEGDPNSAGSKQGGLRLDDYTRKTQDLADQRQRLEADYQRRVETSQAQMQEQLNQQKDLIATLKPPDANDDLIGRALQNPELTQEDRIGLSVIQGVQQENVYLYEQISAMQQRLDAIEPTVSWNAASTQQMTQAQQDQQGKIINEQLAEADKDFGAGKTDAAGDHIRALWKRQNPLTQQPYTIPEIVAMAHGLPAKAQEEAVGKQSNGRAKAKKRVSTPSQPAQSVQEGSLSPREAMDIIDGTMN